MNTFEKNIRRILNGPFGVILFFVSAVAFYLPYELEIIPEVEKIRPYVCYICGALVLVFFFLLYCPSLRIFRDNWYFWVAAVWIGLFIYTTSVHDGVMSDILGYRGLSMIFYLMNIAIFFKVNQKRYLLITFFIFLAFSVANIYTVFAYEGVGMWVEYGKYKSEIYSLVGNYNGGVEVVLPMAICGSAWAHQYGKWLDIINYPAMAANVAMAFKCYSETQKIVYILIIIFMIIGTVAMFSKGFAKAVAAIFNGAVSAGIAIAIYIVIVWMDITGLVSKIGIDPGFHGRRHIWDMAIDWIKQSPYIGWGMESVDVRAVKTVGYAHCHSYFLDVTYQTGFIGTAIVLAMIVITVISIFRAKNKSLAFMLSGLMFCFCVPNIFECYSTPLFMLGFGLIYYIAKNSRDISSRIKKL